MKLKEENFLYVNVHSFMAKSQYPDLDSQIDISFCEKKIYLGRIDCIVESRGLGSIDCIVGSRVKYEVFRFATLCSPSVFVYLQLN